MVQKVFTHELTERYQLVDIFWPRSTMDSIRVSEAPDSGSIPDEATTDSGPDDALCACQDVDMQTGMSASSSFDS